jgi:glycosyltransferase involved in cell wall biosynthesis
VEDQEKDCTKYDLKSLEVFRRIFLETHSFPLSYEQGRDVKRKCLNLPIPLEQVRWKGVEYSFSPNSTNGEKNESNIITEDLHASSSKKKRILLACNYFWPSVGGVETVVANLGRELGNQGYHVDVATTALANRTRSEYDGMHIIPLDVQTTRKFGSHNYPSLCWEFHQLLASGEYDACVLFGNPENWLMVGLLLGDISPRTKLFIQLLVNNEGFGIWGHDLSICDRLTKILQKADGALALTQQGIDAGFMNKAGLSPFYLPNATTPAVQNMNFRETYGIPQDAFLIVHVANIWKVKNHLGLIRTFSAISSNWKLVLIGMPYDKGGPEEKENAEQVAEALQGRPEFLYIPGLPSKDIAAAIETANMLVLASHSEISPMAIVEAMSYGTPWLATPECGDVAEKAGGIVAPLELFPMMVKILQQHSELRVSLGKLGFAHWQSCYSWDVVREGWVEIIEKGSLSKDYGMPKEIATQMDSLQKHFDPLVASYLSQSYDHPPRELLGENSKRQSSFHPASRAVSA